MHCTGIDKGQGSQDSPTSPRPTVGADPLPATPATGTCGHCLRQAFTARINGDLDRGAAINLIAAPGQGSGRLLADLRHLGGRGPRLVTSLKRHRQSLPALIADLWHQTGLDGHPPTTLGTLSDRLERNAPGAALLLHRFDAILDNPELDIRYDDRFIDALNALRNRGLSLVCVSVGPLQRHLILTRAGVRRGSTLDLVREDLPALAWTEIAAEIERRAPPLDADARAFLASAVLADSRPMDLLDLTCRRLRDGTDSGRSLPERLARWGLELRRERRRLGPSTVARLRDYAVTGWTASGIGKVLPIPRLGTWISGLLTGKGGKKA